MVDKFLDIFIYTKRKKKKRKMKIIINSLLEDLRMSLLYFNFAIIYIIHKILVLLKNHLNISKDNIFECFFQKHNIISFLKKIFDVKSNA